MTGLHLRKLVTALATVVALMGFGSPALADWRRVESGDFAVSTIDRAMLIRFNLPPNQVDARKLPTYPLSTLRDPLMMLPCALDPVRPGSSGSVDASAAH